jgi:hypothetical protein
MIIFAKSICLNEEKKSIDFFCHMPEKFTSQKSYAYKNWDHWGENLHCLNEEKKSQDPTAPKEQMSA